MNKILPIFLPVLIIMSCEKGKPSKNQEIEITNKELPAGERAEKALYDEVIAVHDAIMPKMDNMMRLKGQLREKLDLGRDQNTINEKEQETLGKAIDDLEAANEAMMQWMRTFEPQDNNDDHQAVLGYYKKKKAGINKVKEQMAEAMDQAEKILEK